VTGRRHASVPDLHRTLLSDNFLNETGKVSDKSQVNACWTASARLSIVADNPLAVARAGRRHLPTITARRLDDVTADPHLSDMFSVEVISTTDDGELLSERTNIPCACNCEEAQRIVRIWLAARCPILHRATLARLFDGEKKIYELPLDA
jgi:hypothetical protein